MGKLTTIGIPSGGSTGEVLKKKTGTNYDVEWGTGGGGGSGTVTSIATSAPITGGTITTSGTIGITQATTSTDGYLSSTDWNTFNGKQNALTNPVTGTGTSGYVTYWTGSNSVSGESNLFWDATNDRLGIKTSSPAFTLDVNGTAQFQGNLTISDAINVILGTTTGTKIGTSTSQKIGFFNSTPVVKPSAVTTAQGIADALSSLGLLASSSIDTTVSNKLYFYYNFY